MAIESDGHGGRTPRMFELIEDAPRTGASPTIWSYPALVEFMKVAGQPVAGPWPPHQRRRPDPEEDILPVAIVDPGLGAEPDPGIDSAGRHWRDR